MKSILLDTCAALWVASGEIGRNTVDVLIETRELGLTTYVSPITAWEIGLLARKGRFKSSTTPQRWFERLMSAPSTALAALTPEILMSSSFLPGNMNDDPADRIIAATAREFDYTVMTRDRGLLDYGREGYLSVLEC